MLLPQMQVTCLQSRENTDFKKGGGGLAVHKYFLHGLMTAQQKKF